MGPHPRVRTLRIHHVENSRSIPKADSYLPLRRNDDLGGRGRRRTGVRACRIANRTFNERAVAGRKVYETVFVGSVVATIVTADRRIVQIVDRSGRTPDVDHL